MLPMVVLMYDLNIARLLLFLALMSSLFQSSTVFGMNDREYICVLHIGCVRLCENRKAYLVRSPTRPGSTKSDMGVTDHLQFCKIMSIDAVFF